MAAKTAKTRNTERRSGKAWSKSHTATIKVLTPEQQERKAHKDAERARRRHASHEKGSNITMPSITWNWATETMSARWPNTRKVRMVDACIARGRASNDD